MYHWRSRESSLEAATLRTCLSTNPNFLMALPSAPENNRASLGYNMGSTYRKNPYVKFTFHSPRNGALTSKNVSSPSKKKTKTHSVNSGAYLQSVKQCLDPNFVQFVPAKYEFPDKKSLPQSMAHLSPDDEVVNFYPVTRKGRNYLKYCKGWLFDDGKPSNIVECVRKYTSDRNWYCTEVNLALASDSPRLFQYGPYIRELKYSISESRMNFRGTVFRGVDMSPTEVSRYEAQSIFFIPSFTSTSKTRPFGCKNTLIHVDITPEWSKFCMEIQPEHTNYSQQEEILFSCYNLYRYLRTEKSNSHRIIKLELLDYHQYFDSRQNAIRSDYLPYYAI